jgi:hypothetical protein
MLEILDRLTFQDVRRVLLGIQNRLVDFMDITLSTDGTLAGNSDLYVATQKATKTYADTKLASVPANTCRIKTGTYTGDGSTGLAITGVGFTPKFLWILRHNLADAATHAYVKLDQGWADYAFFLQSSTSAVQVIMNNDKINSLDANGFTVDDDGSDLHPNKSGDVYDYIALGV